MVPFKMMVYVKDLDKYMEIDSVPKNYKPLNISGTEFRSCLVKKNIYFHADINLQKLLV